MQECFSMKKTSAFIAQIICKDQQESIYEVDCPSLERWGEAQAFNRSLSKELQEFARKFSINIDQSKFYLKTENSQVLLEL
jgi:hypothetical protein